jgi:hypothetical protein
VAASDKDTIRHQHQQQQQQQQQHKPRFSVTFFARLSPFSLTSFIVSKCSRSFPCSPKPQPSTPHYIKFKSLNPFTFSSGARAPRSSAHRLWFALLLLIMSFKM